MSSDRSSCHLSRDCKSGHNGVFVDEKKNWHPFNVDLLSRRAKAEFEVLSAMTCYDLTQLRTRSWVECQVLLAFLDLRWEFQGDVVTKMTLKMVKGENGEDGNKEEDDIERGEDDMKNGDRLDDLGDMVVRAGRKGEDDSEKGEDDSDKGGTPSYINGVRNSVPPTEACTKIEPGSCGSQRQEWQW